MNSFVWPHSRPKIVIENMGGAMISPCYSSSSWKITSTYRLQKSTITEMFRLGLVGFGQEFNIRSQCDGKEQPAGEDVVECVAVDSRGNVLSGPAINPYTDEVYQPHRFPYFVYNCVSRCDSSD